MPKAHCSRQQTVKRAFGTRCVGVTLAPRQLALRIRLCSKVGGLSTDMCLRHIHIPLELLLFQRSRHATSLQLFWLIFPKNTFSIAKKLSPIVSIVVTKIVAYICGESRSYWWGGFRCVGVERRLIRRPPLSFVPWWPPARRRSTRWRGTHICLAARGGRCGR